MLSPDPRFRGGFTAIVTPFSADGSSIDFGALKAQIEFQARGERGTGGVKGIVVAGTTGESPTLEKHEYIELLEKAIGFAKPWKLLVIAGTGSNSTHHAVELQKLAAKAGADAALSVNPYYNKPTQEGMYAHFMAQAESAKLPIVLYNIPGRTGVALTTDTIERLAAHPNIRAVKEATGSTDSCGDIASRCPGLAVLSGDDTMTLPFASVGAVGVVSVISNLVPGRVQALCDAFNGGDFALALRLHRELLKLSRAMFTETNPIPLKAAMQILGRDSGTLRLPMTRATQQTFDNLKKVLPAYELGA